MGWNISMFLVNKLLDEEQKLSFVKKYYRSYEKKSITNLDLVLYPRNNSLYMGDYNGSTIITHCDLPKCVNWEAKDVGVFERKQIKTSKLCRFFKDSDIFSIVFSDVGSIYNYAFFRKGYRIRHKRNQIRNDFNLCEEVGNPLPEEQEFYAYSRILKIEPGRKVVYSNSIGTLHKNYYSSREYYSKYQIETEGNPLGEYQFGYEIIMACSKRFLGKRLEQLHLDKIPMIEFGK